VGGRAYDLFGVHWLTDRSFQRVFHVLAQRRSGSLRLSGGEGHLAGERANSCCVIAGILTI
jgi:hypothetical protein